MPGVPRERDDRIMGGGVRPPKPSARHVAAGLAHWTEELFGLT